MSVDSRHPRSASRRYLAWGVVLGLALPVGHFIATSLAAMQAPTGDWLSNHFATFALTYLYVTGAGVALLGGLGFVIGRHQDVLRELSMRDPLTGAWNRAALFNRLNEEVERSGRTGQPLSVLLLDIDHFKSINDSWGHIAGDSALRAVANSIRGAARLSDFIARYGGDEMAVVAPNTSAAQAVTLAHRIRAGVQRVAAATNGGRLELTISVGVADLTPPEQKTIHDLLQQADDGLYTAKAWGRNRVAAVSASTQWLDRAPPGVQNPRPEPVRHYGRWIMAPSLIVRPGSTHDKGVASVPTEVGIDEHHAMHD